MRFYGTVITPLKVKGKAIPVQAVEVLRVVRG
jgi:hypothetical protein